MNGLLVNPEIGTTTWYHGSGSCKKLTNKQLTDEPKDVDHAAFFITSSEEYGHIYATYDSNNEQNMCQGLYEINIQTPIKLFHADLIIENEQFTTEGNALLDVLVEQDAEYSGTSREQFEESLRTVAQTLDWTHFVDVDYYESSGVLPDYAIVNAISELGYDGWVERRSVGKIITRADIAIFHRAISKVKVKKCVFFNK